MATLPVMRILPALFLVGYRPRWQPGAAEAVGGVEAARRARVKSCANSVIPTGRNST